MTVPTPWSELKKFGLSRFLFAPSVLISVSSAIIVSWLLVKNEIMISEAVPAMMKFNSTFMLIGVFLFCFVMFKSEMFDIIKNKNLLILSYWFAPMCHAVAFAICPVRMMVQEGTKFDAVWLFFYLAISFYASFQSYFSMSFLFSLNATENLSEE